MILTTSETIMRKTSDKPYRFIRAKGRPIQVIFQDIPGKRFSAGTTDMYEAVLWAEKFRRERGWRSESPTFREFADDFFYRDSSPNDIRVRDIALGRERKDYYYRRRQKILDTYLIPVLGSYKLSAITPPLIEMTILSLDGVRHELSGQSKRAIYAVLKIVMNDAYRLGLIDHNPACKDLVKLPADTPVKTIRALTPYEQSKLFPLDADCRIAVYGSLLWATYFSIMYSTGFRPGEVRGIEVSDLVSCPRGVVVDISHSVPCTTDEREDRVKTTGRGFSTRTGVLDPITEELVIRLIREKHLGPRDPLFVKCSNKHRYISQWQGNKYFRSACHQLGLTDAEELTQYCIRHTFGTEHKGALGDEVLADLMGHAGGKMLDTYDNRDKAQRVSLADAERDKIVARKSESLTVPLYEKIKEA